VRLRRRRRIRHAGLVVTAVVVLVAFVALRGSPPIASYGGPEAVRGVPTAIDLSGGSWELRLGQGPWKRTHVPGVFDPRPDRAAYHGTVGWYRLRFVPPRVAARFGWALRFEQARRTADVWLNGLHLGANTATSMPFTLEARGLRPGKVNELLVRVDSRKPPNSRDSWWNWGGLTRRVWLVPQGPAKLDPLGLVPQVSCTGSACSAKVLVSGSLADRTASPIRATVEVALTSPGGTVTRRTLGPIRLRPGHLRSLKSTIPIRGRPRLWWPERPSLYNAVVRVKVDGEISQIQRTSIGLRQVKSENGELYLNGRRLQARGASIQEDVPGQGAGLSDAGLDTVVGDLRHLHADVTRMQYLPNPGILDRLDDAGIMLWSQSAVQIRDNLKTAAGRAAALRIVRATVLATRNHPSVLVHSVANELASGPDRRPGTRIFLRRAAALTRRLDPSVPVAVDIRAAPGMPAQQAYSDFDVLGLTAYFGWYHGMLGHHLGPLSNLKVYLEKTRRQYPGKAVAVTEFGAEAMQPGSALVKSTYGFQTDYLEQSMRIIDEEPWVAAAIWFSARDFAIKPFWGGGAHIAHAARDALHSKGLYDYAGAPKPAAAVARRLFQATPPFAADPAPPPVMKPGRYIRTGPPPGASR
jgi:hypothetical protein